MLFLQVVAAVGGVLMLGVMVYIAITCQFADKNEEFEVPQRYGSQNPGRNNK